MHILATIQSDSVMTKILISVLAAMLTTGHVQLLTTLNVAMWAGHVVLWESAYLAHTRPWNPTACGIHTQARN